MAQDLYQTVTDRIIEQLEAGTMPWVKSWSTTGTNAPKNAISGKAYRGINTMLLCPPAGSVGNSWMTFKQAKDLGAHVRKGEKGQMIVFFKNYTAADVNNPDGAEKKFFVLRNFTVFHTSQIENLPAKYLPVAEAPMTEAQRIEAADKILAQAIINHGGSDAFYRPSTDSIQLPPAEAFNTIGDYYAAAFHELTHWTGAKSRCDRDFSGRFGDTAYAREELVAEMGAAFLMAQTQIEGEMQHASYIASWLKVLKNDKRAVFVAASAAQKAVDFVLADTDAENTEDTAAADLEAA